jgi:hypothetical protein
MEMWDSKTIRWETAAVASEGKEPKIHGDSLARGPKPLVIKNCSWDNELRIYIHIPATMENSMDPPNTRSIYWTRPVICICLCYAFPHLGSFYRQQFGASSERITLYMHCRLWQALWSNRAEFRSTYYVMDHILCTARRLGICYVLLNWRKTGIT